MTGFLNRVSADHIRSACRKEHVRRQCAAPELLSGLERYELCIPDTIGLRQQPRMPREQAVELVDCTAKHRNLCIHF
jgi:hypothetical protein